MGKTQKDFAELLGIKRSALGSYEEGRATPKTDVMQKLANLYHISLDELISADLREKSLFNRNKKAAHTQKDISGKNLQLRTLLLPTDESAREKISFVEAKASAGYLQGHSDEAFMSNLQTFHLPFLPPDTTYRAFEIQGDSMLPIPSGSIVISEYVQDWQDIKSGQTYVVVSKSEGLVYKRLINNLNKNQQLICQSDNPNYDPFTLPVEDVQEVWKACRFIIQSDENLQSSDQVWQKALVSEIQKLSKHIDEKIKN